MPHGQPRRGDRSLNTHADRQSRALSLLCFRFFFIFFFWLTYLAWQSAFSAEAVGCFLPRRCSRCGCPVGYCDRCHCSSPNLHKHDAQHERLSLLFLPSCCSRSRCLSLSLFFSYLALLLCLPLSNAVSSSPSTNLWFYRRLSLYAFSLRLAVNALPFPFFIYF